LLRYGSSELYTKDGVTQAAMKEAVSAVNSIRKMSRDMSKVLGVEKPVFNEIKYEKDAFPSPIPTRFAESKESTIARVIAKYTEAKNFIDRLGSKKPEDVRYFQNIVGPMNEKYKFSVAFQ